MKELARYSIGKVSVSAGYGPISWADLEVLAAKVANEASWRVIKTKGGLPSSGDVISSAFGAAWPVKLGRHDADKPDPANRLPLPEASVQEITVRSQCFFNTLSVCTVIVVASCPRVINLPTGILWTAQQQKLWCHWILCTQVNF